MTDGYSGSDLKNLAVAAAYRPIQDVLKAEEKARWEEQAAVEAAGTEGEVSGNSKGKDAEGMEKGAGRETSGEEVKTEQSKGGWKGR